MAKPLAARIAERALAKRETESAAEVRRLLDAGLEAMRRCGTRSRPRVADIVAAAGLSNDAFYRHFPSKEALVAAILEDGLDRLRSYLAHQMDKEAVPEGKVRRWVEGVLLQAADEDIASATLAVLWNAGALGGGMTRGQGGGDRSSDRSSGRPSDRSSERPPDRPSASGPLSTLLREPFAELGSTDPDLDASLAAHAVVNKLSDHLWDRTHPTPAEIDHIARFCLAAVRPR